MRMIIIVLLVGMVGFVGGCSSEHTVVGTLYDDKGAVLSSFEIVLPRPMEVEYTDGDKTVKANSLGQGGWGEVVKGATSLAGQIVMLGFLKD